MKRFAQISIDCRMRDHKDCCWAACACRCHPKRGVLDPDDGRRRRRAASDAHRLVDYQLGTRRR